MKERLKALYKNNMDGLPPSISLDGIINAVVKGWITLEDAIEIAGGDGGATIEILRTVKLKEISKACESTIISGIEVTLGEEVLHFSLTANDQMNLSTAINTVTEGAPAFPYHNDGGLCRLYSAEEIITIGRAATQFILYHTTYCNHLNYFIRRIDDAATLSDISYGVELPSDLADNMQTILQQAQGE